MSRTTSNSAGRRLECGNRRPRVPACGARSAFRGVQRSHSEPRTRLPELDRSRAATRVLQPIGRGSSAPATSAASATISLLKCFSLMAKRSHRSTPGRHAWKRRRRSRLPWVAVALAAAAVAAWLIRRPGRRAGPAHASSAAQRRWSGRAPRSSQRSPAPLNRQVPAPAGMVWIPGGEFSMGAAETLAMSPVGMQATTDSRPVHRVAVDGFWMDETEVTNAQFAAFVRETSTSPSPSARRGPRIFPACRARSWSPDRWSSRRRRSASPSTTRCSGGATSRA